MDENGSNAVCEENDLQTRLTGYERDIRKLNREITHLKHAVEREKTAYTTVLNQQKASTFIIRERERYLALLLANSPSIILFLSQTGRIEFCTDYFIRKAGIENTTDVLGHTLTEVFSPFLDDALHAELQEQSNRVLETNEPTTFDITFHFASNGMAEDFTGLLVPMKDEQHKSNGLLLMLHDITDLKQSREEALAASRAKSSFLSNMSHEIRTPMNAIIGMTSIGMNETDMERKNYAFAKIESASVHLLGVINDILDISKIESGKMELSNIHFSFSQMIDRVTSVIATKIHERNQHFTIELDPEIPDVLYGDDQRLAQVITNLLSNAAKFTPENGSITLIAKVIHKQENSCKIHMLVKDTGIGMTPLEIGKLFNAFQQAQAGTARKFGGTGLGLAISKRILELMGGEIWVESEPEQGSCFHFTVNLIIPEPREGLTNFEQIIQSDINEHDFSDKTILIVDDVEINLEIAIALLEPTEMTIDAVKSGREALDAFIRDPERYDLILMDLQMPGMDGLEATRMIRELGTAKAAAIPIIAMTANVFKEDIEKCKQAGMNDHLGKPIDMNEVNRLLSRYLGGV